MQFPNNFSPLIVTPLIAFGLFLFFFSYIQTEVLTSFYASEFDSVRFCKSDKNSDFKILKIVNLEKNRNSGRIYCLYGDIKKNSILDLNLDETGFWKVEFGRYPYSNNGFFWPIYY